MNLLLVDKFRNTSQTWTIYHKSLISFRKYDHKTKKFHIINSTLRIVYKNIYVEIVFLDVFDVKGETLRESF